MTEIVFFLEEASAEAMLDGFLPRILPESVYHRCVVFEGKQDLEKQLVKRMKGYRVPGALFVVLRDQDSSDCKLIKTGLVEKCNQATHPEALVRIACRELESWYLADLVAVEKAFDVPGLSKFQEQKRYNNPDVIDKPSIVLSQIVSSYQKVGGSRQIGLHLSPDNQRSKSFHHFVSGVRRMLNTVNQ